MGPWLGGLYFTLLLLLEYVNLIVLVSSINKMLPSVKFAEYKVLTFLILREKC